MRNELLSRGVDWSEQLIEDYLALKKKEQLLYGSGSVEYKKTLEAMEDAAKVYDRKKEELDSLQKLIKSSENTLKEIDSDIRKIAKASSI